MLLVWDWFVLTQSFEISKLSDNPKRLITGWSWEKSNIMWLFWKLQIFSHWWNPTCCFNKYSNFPLGTEWKLLSKVSSPLRKRSTDLFRLCAESDNLEISMICVFWNNLSFDSEDLMRTTGPSVRNKERLVWELLKILWKVGLWYLDHLKGCADLSQRVFMTSNKRMKE